MKRKILGISFLLCMLVPISTSYIFLQFQKKQVKSEVKWKMIKNIDKEELVLLKFKKSEINSKIKWEHSKEFEYKGEMYDIAKMEIKGDTIYYWCWWDYKETELNNKLDNLLNFVLGHDTKRKESIKLVEKFYKSLYCNPLPDWDNYPSLTLLTSIPFKNNYKTTSYPPPVPPPQIS